MEFTQVASCINSIVFFILLDIQFVIEVLDLHQELSRINQTYIDGLCSIDQTSWSVNKELFFLWCDCSIQKDFDQLFEFIYLYQLVLIFRVGVLFHLLRELFPLLLAGFHAPTFDHVLHFLGVHLVVEEAVVAIADTGLPALKLKTCALLHDLNLVLPEIQRFTWMYLTPDHLGKIWVWYLAVAIKVEGAVHRFKLFLSKFKPPVIKIELQLALWYVSCFSWVFVDIGEGLPYCFPLYGDLFNDWVYQVPWADVFVDGLLLLQVWIDLSEIFVVTRVLDRIMSEIKAFAHMYAIAQPWRKVLIWNPTLFIFVLWFDQLPEIVVAKISVAKCPKEVFDRDEPIMIWIKS